MEQLTLFHLLGLEMTLTNLIQFEKVVEQLINPLLLMLFYPFIYTGSFLVCFFL